MAEMSDRKSYLGDGVYVDVDSGYIVLSTENGVSTTNTIYLEPEVWSELLNYVKRFTASRGAEIGEQKS